MADAAIDEHSSDADEVSGAVVEVRVMTYDFRQTVRLGKEANL